MRWNTPTMWEACLTHNQLAGIVINDPPDICAVKLSASQRNGKIAHNEYSPTKLRKVGLAMRFTPKTWFLMRRKIAIAIPLIINNKKKSMRKKSNEPRSVTSSSATK